MEEMLQKATTNMIDAINNLSEKDRDFLLNYKPCIIHGYAWDTGSDYNRIKNILSIKTDSDGHSGASFSVCLRSAIERLNTILVVPCRVVVYADEVLE